MKFLDVGLALIFTMYLILLIVGYDTKDIHNINDSKTLKLNTEPFQYKDVVYIYPDSTKAIIENAFFLVRNIKNKTQKSRIILIESYTIMYTDKTGKINRLKGIDPEFILSGERYENGKTYTIIPIYKSK